MQQALHQDKSFFLLVQGDLIMSHRVWFRKENVFCVSMVCLNILHIYGTMATILYGVDYGTVRGLKFYDSDYLQLYHPSLQSWAIQIFFKNMDIIPMISISFSGTMALFKQILLIRRLQGSVVLGKCL